METYVVSDTKLGSGWESDTNVRKVIGDVTKSHITVFTSVGDLDKMKNEYGHEYEYGYNNFILVLNCRYETRMKNDEG